MDETPAPSSSTTAEPVAGPSATITPEEKRKILAALPKKKKSQRLKEKKLRESYRLRKLVAPKHALLAINELKGVEISNFTYVLNSTGGQQSLTGEATINGVKYTGVGRSKNAAKTDICDQALRDIMLKKMQVCARAQIENKELSPDEELPIVTLVSYAIHKLFADWEAEGYCLKCAGTRNNVDPNAPCTCPDGKSTGLQAAITEFNAVPPELKDQPQE